MNKWTNKTVSVDTECHSAIKEKRKIVQTYQIDGLENNIREDSQKIVHSGLPNIHEMVRVGNSLKA